LIDAFIKENVSIPWYIMTSDATNESTEKYFEENQYFGLERRNVFIFEQRMLPCLTPDGKIIMESSKKVSRAPNGNGGLYGSLETSGALLNMSCRGIELVFQYCVDNILVKMADPIFIGFCFDRGVDCAAKVLEKATPNEPVGVLCLKNNRPAVVEYSELPNEYATLINSATGKLVYNEAHICMNAFTVEFLKRIIASKLDFLPFHVAKKKIASIDADGNPTYVDGWKMEMFVFDVFEYATKMSAFEVRREDEFSPLKNGPESPTDSPVTCRNHISRLHQKLIRKAGGIIEPNVDNVAICEVSPLLCLSSEDIEDLRSKVNGTKIELPSHICPN